MGMVTAACRDSIQYSYPFLVIDSAMQVIVNGEPRRLDTPITIAELVERLSTGARRIAIERNGEVVPRSRHATTTLADGDRIEVVVAVGGG